MTDLSVFIFQKWESHVPYYALMKLEKEKICALEVTWGAARSKGVGAALVATFGGGWVSVMKEAGKQSLKIWRKKSSWLPHRRRVSRFWFGIYCQNLLN